MNRATGTVLLLTLAAYPAIRAAEPAFYFVGGPGDWWRFWGFTAVAHWSCFGLVAWALWRSDEGWTTIGLDWAWFVRNRRLLVVALGLLVAGVFVVSAVYSSPAREGLFPLHAVTRVERLFMIFGAIVTAGVVEEVVFRGFAITRLGKLLGSPWRALPFSVVSFVFLHGMPTDPARTASYLIGGLVLGTTFIWLKCRRLEILVLVHGLINLPLLFMP